MTILTFPTLARGAGQVSWRLRALTQVHTSPLDGTTQTLAQPGARWAATVSFPTLAEADRRALEAFLASLLGRAGRFYYGPPHGARRATGFAGRQNYVHNGEFAGAGVGTVPTTWELTAGPGMTAAISATATDGNGTYVEITLSGTPTTAVLATFRAAAATAAPAASGQDWTAAITMQTQATPTNVTQIRPALYDVDGGTIGSFTFGAGSPAEMATVTRRSVTRTLAAPGCVMGIDIRGEAGIAADLVLRVWTPHLNRGDFAETYVATTTGPVAIAEGPYINGAGQGGSALAIDGFQAGAEAFRVGDWLSYTDTAGRRRLHIVTADVTANDSGQAYTPIAPPIRRAGADNAAVEIAAPTGVFMLAEDENGMTTRPPLLGSFTLEMMEALV